MLSCSNKGGGLELFIAKIANYTANKSCQLQPDYSQMAVILLELQSMAVHSQ